jgi:hypothetical protein
MNERIKELADQAGEYVNEVYTPPVRSKTPGKIWEGEHVDWHTQFNQKFAELIVKECAEVLLKWKNEPFPFDEDMAVSLIKEHFGVKE